MTAMLLAAGGTMDATTALELMETILRLWREGQGGATKSDNSVVTSLASASDGAPGRDQGSYARIPDVPARYSGADRRAPVPAPASNGGGVSHGPRKLPARTTYSLAPAKAGRTLQLHRPTPATMKIIGFLTGKTNVTMDEIEAGTGLKNSTIANILTDLRKQHAVQSAAIGQESRGSRT